MFAMMEEQLQERAEEDVVVGALTGDVARVENGAVEKSRWDPVTKVRTKSTPVTLESFEDSRDGAQAPAGHAEHEVEDAPRSSRCSGTPRRDL